MELPQMIQGVQIATEHGWLADRWTVSQQLGALQTHTIVTFLFISNTTNVLLFKFRCNIFIGVRIIKEIPDSVASGTYCTTSYRRPKKIHEFLPTVVGCPLRTNKLQVSSS